LEVQSVTKWAEGLAKGSEAGMEGSWELEKGPGKEVGSAVRTEAQLVLKLVAKLVLPSVALMALGKVGGQALARAKEWALQWALVLVLNCW
jgi:hypothetical protein